MAAAAGAEPSLAKIDVGLFAPGTPMASDVGVEITRQPDDYEIRAETGLLAGGALSYYPPANSSSRRTEWIRTPRRLCCG
jgi:peptide/nickel transport system substrate-binding protein